MDITTLPLPSDLDVAEHNLREAGIEYCLVCDGPETVCPVWTVPTAA